jgi:hypothetical protein
MDETGSNGTSSSSNRLGEGFVDTGVMSGICWGAADETCSF